MLMTKVNEAEGWRAVPDMGMAEQIRNVMQAKHIKIISRTHARVTYELDLKTENTLQRFNTFNVWAKTPTKYFQEVMSSLQFLECIHNYLENAKRINPEFMQYNQQVTAACCSGEFASSCVAGLPSTSCDDQCAAVLLPMQRACSAFLVSVGMQDTISGAVAACGSGH